MNGEKRTILHIVEGSFLWRSPNYDDLQNISSGPESRATILGMILQCLMMQGGARDHRKSGTNRAACVDFCDIEKRMSDVLDRSKTVNQTVAVTFA